MFCKFPSWSKRAAIQSGSLYSLGEGKLSMGLCTCLLSSVKRPGRSTNSLTWHCRRRQSCICAQLRPTLCDPMDGSPPGSSALLGGFFYHWATREPPGTPEDIKFHHVGAALTWPMAVLLYTENMQRAWRGCQPLGPLAFQTFRSVWRTYTQWGSANI